jgi:hypothetical protein
MQRKRFVIQEHTTAEGIHWDLMLEQGDVLTTFRLEEMPSAIRGHRIRAERIFDHPLRFLTYEGPVQQGTGHVRIVDRGPCHSSDRSGVATVLELSGNVLHGSLTLTRTREAIWNVMPTDGSAQE